MGTLDLAKCGPIHWSFSLKIFKCPPFTFGQHVDYHVFIKNNNKTKDVCLHFTINKNQSSPHPLLCINSFVLMDMLRTVLKQAAGKVESTERNENLAWHYSLESIREGVCITKGKQEVTLSLISRVNNALFEFLNTWSNPRALMNNSLNKHK